MVPGKTYWKSKANWSLKGCYQSVKFGIKKKYILKEVYSERKSIFKDSLLKSRKEISVDVTQLHKQHLVSAVFSGCPVVRKTVPAINRSFRIRFERYLSLNIAV